MHCTNLGANPKLTSVSQRGRRQQEREKWAKGTPRTPRPATAVGGPGGDSGTPLAAAPYPAGQVSTGRPRGGARLTHRPPSGRHHHRAGKSSAQPSTGPPGPPGPAAPCPQSLPTRAATPGARLRPGAFVLSSMALAHSPRGAGDQAHPRTKRTQTQGVRGWGRCEGAQCGQIPPCGGRDLGWVA